MPHTKAIRVVIRGDACGESLLATTVRRAHALSVLGWVRADEDGIMRIHAEGLEDALGEFDCFLREGAPVPAGVEIEQVAPEGHEQFAIRGVSAGDFAVQEHWTTAHHFELRLEVDGMMRSWAVPKGLSMDPAIKRFAIELADHDREHDTFEGRHGDGAVIVWDRGPYEQGGRVPWPEALARGHAVFVLHGEKLRGGFALQRTRRGPKAQWLLIKRRDEQARPGSDIGTELPRSVISGRTLEEIRGVRKA